MLMFKGKPENGPVYHATRRRAGGLPHTRMGSRRFEGIHFQESDLSFEQNLCVFASVKAPDFACFPEVIKRTLPWVCFAN